MSAGKVGAVQLVSMLDELSMQPKDAERAKAKKAYMYAGFLGEVIWLLSYENKVLAEQKVETIRK